MFERDFRRLLAWTGLTIALAFAVVQACMPNGVLPIDMATWFANGFAVAVYAPLIRVVGPRRGAIWSSVLLGLVGASHAIWLAASSSLLNDLTTARGFWPLFLLTGAVFAGLVSLALPRWSTVMIMAAATAFSVAASARPALWSSVSLRPPHMVGFPAMFLHAGIATALFLPARREWSKPHSSACQGCGYDLTGISGRPCPECGRTHPSSVVAQRET